MSADIAALIAEANAVVVNRRWGIDPEVKRLVNHLAMALEASQPRVVTTVEELDALPIDAVVVDFAGCPRTKRGRDSYMPAGWTNAGKSPLRSTELADGHPMKVVYEGRPVPAHRQVWC